MAMFRHSEHRQALARELDRRTSALGEHRRILRSERDRRSQLQEARTQHRRILHQIRADLSRQRRLHKDALAENPWLMKLADMILARRAARNAGRSGQPA